jgi:hypothetical protein
MKLQWIAITTLFSAFCWAGNDRGNGGDPLRFDFEVGRAQAAQRLNNIRPCSFNAGVPADVKNWILEHQAPLAEDILHSNHVWITDPQSTCAFTQATARADIILSFETCRSGIKNPNDAGRLLVHESTHHFGVTDETFADQVAQAIYTAGSNSSCEVPPAQDPFDSASCPGSRLSTNELKGLIDLPNSNETVLGGFTVSGRVRTCYAQDWCTVWQDANDTFSRPKYDPNTGKHYEIEMVRTGTLSARLFENTPEIRIVSDAMTDKYPKGEDYYFYYKMNSRIVDSEHMSIKSSDSSSIFSGGNTIDGNSLVGWVTPTCFRQVFQTEKKDKDNLGNDIVKQYEVVFLSRFNK